MSTLEFPKGHPIHEVSLNGKDIFGHLPEKQIKKGHKRMDKPYLGEADYQADLRRAKKAKTEGRQSLNWVLKHRKTHKINYWYISYRDGMMSLILGPVMAPANKIFWETTVSILNRLKVEAAVDLHMFGID